MHNAAVLITVLIALTGGSNARAMCEIEEGLCPLILDRFNTSTRILPESIGGPKHRHFAREKKECGPGYGSCKTGLCCSEAGEEFLSYSLMATLLIVSRLLRLNI